MSLNNIKSVERSVNGISYKEYIYTISVGTMIWLDITENSLGDIIYMDFYKESSGLFNWYVPNNPISFFFLSVWYYPLWS